MPKTNVEALVTFLPTEYGGKVDATRTGYRGQFHYGGSDWDAAYVFPDVDEIEPGQTARVLLAFMSPQVHVGHVRAGMPFVLREGQKVVAYGSITSVIDL